MRNTSQQNACVDLYMTKKSFKVEAIAGSGKEQPISCLIQTPKGPKKLGEIKVGDKVLNTYGGVSSVVGVFPQGIKASYRVSFSDDTYTYCGLEHLWQVSSISHRSPIQQVMTLAQIREGGVTKANGGLKYRIELTHEVDYKRKCQKVHAYLLGLLLGGGCLVSDIPNVSVNIQDTELIKAIKAYCLAYGLKSDFRCISKKELQAFLVSSSKALIDPTNWLKEELRFLNLNVKDANKFIPKIYLQGSVEQRKLLLKGVMDSGGNYTNSRALFSTSSKELLQGIKTLVHSLGGVVVERADYERESRTTFYNLSIKTPFNPFGYSCKGLGWRLCRKNIPSRHITSVEYAGEEEQLCIKVNAKNSLYLTDNFIVTHNTTTIRIMAESAMDRTALYLAFNKKAAREASEKMPINTRCCTTHSIAYGIILGRDEAMRNKLSRPAWNPEKYVNAGGTIKEIAGLVRAKDVPGASRFVIAREAKKTVACFEASASKRISEYHIHPKAITKLKDKSTIVNTAFSEKQFCAEVLRCANTLWKERIDRYSPVVMTHDTYLKLYQLSGATLNYDVIFLDEAQDTSDCVIDIVMQQINRGTQVVCVGDTFQAIYGWRGAVNALAKIDIIRTPLTQSWRYGPEVASVASYILNGAIDVRGAPHLNTIVGVVDTDTPYTQLFRTNTKLIQQGIKLIRQGVSVSMEVDIRGFVKMLTSMVALKRGDRKNVKHEEVIIHTTWKDLLEEAEVVKGELKLLSRFVEKGNVDEVLRILRDHTNARNPHVTLSTAHKSKGMEYEQVILADDFMGVYDEEGNFVEPNKMERNLLYVSVTRAKGVLQLNKTVIDIIQHRKEKEHSNTTCIEESEYSNDELCQLGTPSIEEKFNRVIRNQVKFLQTDIQI